LAGVGPGVANGRGVLLGLRAGVWTGVSAGAWVAESTAVTVLMLVAAGVLVGDGRVVVGDMRCAVSVISVNVSGDGRTAVLFRGTPLSRLGTQAAKIKSKAITKGGNSLFTIEYR